MKILTQVGSKDRLIEIFQRVNKVKLNEEVLQNNGSTGVLANAFSELQNNTLNIKQTNNQATGDETFVELVGTDKAGNEITFRFRVSSTQGDQDGVFGVDNVELKDFIFRSKDGGESVEMDENALKQFNAEHGQELIDIISEYVDVDDEQQPESTDEVYEDAVKLIDKVPYKKGTETMQTNASYADQKPTNPEVRVQSDELSKFISEIQDYDEEQPDVDPMDLPQDYGDEEIPTDEPENDVVNPDSIQPEETEEMTPEKEQIILQAYENLTKKGISAPTTNEILAEIERMNPTQKPVERDPDNHMAAGKTRVYPSYADKFLPEGINETEYPEEMGIAKEIKTTTSYPKPKKKHKIKKLKVKMSESTDQDKYENVVFLQGDEAYQPLEILDTKGKDAAMEYLKQWHYPGEHEGSPELGHGTSDQTYEKDGYIMSWNSQLGYIGLQYDLSQMNEEDDTDEPMDDKPMETPEDVPQGEMNGETDIQQLAQDKEETGEILKGGKGDGKSPLEFDPDQIIKGMEVEKEHTDDPMAAIEIVLDHLTEDPEYYTEKETPEASAQFGAAKDAGEDKEMTDVLLGYKPHNVGDEDELGEAIVGASGAVSVVGSSSTTNSNAVENGDEDSLKKYEDYEKKNFDSLNDTQKEEFFGLWNKYKGKEIN